MSKSKLFQHPRYRAFKAMVEKKDKKAWPEIRKQLVIAYEAGSIPLLVTGDAQLYGCISYWFIWSETPQGFAYWWELSKKYN